MPYTIAGKEEMCTASEDCGASRYIEEMLYEEYKGLQQHGL